jgi:hypothetical protein
MILIIGPFKPEDIPESFMTFDEDATDLFSIRNSRRAKWPPRGMVGPAQRLNPEPFPYRKVLKK